MYSYLVHSSSSTADTFELSVQRWSVSMDLEFPKREYGILPFRPWGECQLGVFEAHKLAEDTKELGWNQVFVGQGCCAAITAAASS